IGSTPAAPATNTLDARDHRESGQPPTSGLEASSRRARYNSPAESVTLPIASRLGGYEIVSVLGTGGMGAVYRARDAKLGRDVAIKVLLPEVANDPDRLARFDREARTLAALNHPHIAHIYGLEQSPVDSAQGKPSDPAHAALSGPFLVMELV